MVLETTSAQLCFLLIHNKLHIDEDLTATQPQKKRKDHKRQVCLRNYQTLPTGETATTLHAAPYQIQQ